MTHKSQRQNYVTHWLSHIHTWKPPLMDCVEDKEEKTEVINLDYYQSKSVKRHEIGTIDKVECF